MAQLLKQALRGWLLLSAVFLAGASAAGFGGGFGMQDWSRSGNVEGHQAMLAHQAADLSRVEINQGLQADLPLVNGHLTFKNSTTNCVTSRANDTQDSLAEFELIPDSDLNLSVLIAQRHGSLDLRDSFNFHFPIIRVHGDIGNFDAGMRNAAPWEFRADHDILLPVALRHESHQAAGQLFHSHQFYYGPNA